MRVGGPCDQRSRVDLVLPECVVLLVLEPRAASASYDVRADHAALRLKGACEIVEVATVTRQPVNAQDHMRISSVAPIGICNLMEPVRVEARVAAFDHLDIVVRITVPLRRERRRDGVGEACVETVRSSIESRSHTIEG